MSLVNRTTKKAVLQGAKALLESTGPFRNRVFITGAEQVPDGVKDKGFITLTLAAGQFENFRAGSVVVPYQATLSVVIWRSDLTERSGVDEKILIGTGTTILDNEQAVLKCLTGQYLHQSNGTVNLTEPFAPVADSDLIKEDLYLGSQQPSGVAYAAMTIQFQCAFHWDLDQ